MQISLIAAASANDVIGVRGELPWHLPNDFKHFKETTMGKPIVMGRRTWESIGRALPGRVNIVLTRNATFDAPEAVVATTRRQAIEAASSAGELMIIGGGEIYREFMPIAACIYLTRVHTQIEGDAHFPPLPETDWQLTNSDAYSADERHAFDYEFQTYERRQV